MSLTMDDFKGELVRCAKEGDVGKIKSLFEGWSSILEVNEPVDDEGNTMLHLAAQSNQVDVFRYLVQELKASQKVENQDNKTPSALAYEASSLGVIAYLTGETPRYRGPFYPRLSPQEVARAVQIIQEAYPDLK